MKIETIPSSFTIPSYTNHGITLGRVIYLDTFLNTVESAGKAYLDHHDLVKNYGQIKRTSIPYNKEYGKMPTNPIQEIGISYDDLIARLDNLKRQFDIENDRQLISAQKTKAFLQEYFWNLCRIGGQQFSYFMTINDESTETEQYFSLNSDPYLSLDVYKAQTSGYFLENMVKQYDIIYANSRRPSGIYRGMIQLIESLIMFNAKQEIMIDYGEVNKKETGETTTTQSVYQEYAVGSALIAESAGSETPSPPTNSSTLIVVGSSSSDEVVGVNSFGEGSSYGVLLTRTNTYSIKYLTANTDPISTRKIHS